ncbi:PREDICTED: alpha-latrocrustotoxin-Lt1a-like, partial [Wasmannia auropunctata]|uniref:alpha-latrocrustotoxin-Lt1a-like n=1 Tax=Wasmannia auropunctata TaxID=64793 RepID=UPI0005ED9E1F
LDSGAGVNIKNNVGNTPLSDAINFNSGSEIIKYLVEKGNNKNIFDAARDGNLGVVRYFVENERIDVNIRDNDSKTPLHWAASNGYLGIVKYLVEQKNADITARENGNGIPLHWAAGGGQLDIVKYFINEKHIDINIRGYVGNTVLHYAVLGRKPNTVKWLLDSGAGVNIKNNVGNTPLSDAINFNSGSEIIKYLVEKGNNKNIFDA